MKINIHNYEAFFLDYHEGMLSPSDKEEIFVFLKQHPELQADFENFEMIVLDPDSSVHFEAKQDLKKEEWIHGNIITSENIDDYLISEREGLLSTLELQMLETFLSQHPEYQRDRRIYAHTVLQPDSKVVFPYKDSLMQSIHADRQITQSNIENYLISEVEGSLNSHELEQLEEFIHQNPQYARDKKLYSLTKLIPDPSIGFEDKSSLKKALVPLRRILYYSLSAAASILLLFSVYTIWTGNHQPGTIQFSEQPANHSPVTHPSVNASTPASMVVAQNHASAGTAVPETSVSVQPKNSQDVGPGIRNSALTAPFPELTAQSYQPLTSKDHVAPEFMFIRTSQMHSNEFLELYYNVKLLEQIQYAQVNQTDPDPEKTIFNAATSRIADFFAFNKNKQASLPETGKQDLSVWTFAELGIRTYNNLAQDNVRLDLNRDETGKVVEYNISGDKLDFQREIRK